MPESPDEAHGCMDEELDAREASGWVIRPGNRWIGRRSLPGISSAPHGIHRDKVLQAAPPGLTTASPAGTSCLS